MTPFGRWRGRDAVSLGSEAVLSALDDSAMTMADMGVFAAGSQFSTISLPTRSRSCRHRRTEGEGNAPGRLHGGQLDGQAAAHRRGIDIHQRADERRPVGQRQQRWDVGTATTASGGAGRTTL